MMRRLTCAAALWIVCVYGKTYGAQIPTSARQQLGDYWFNSTAVARDPAAAMCAARQMRLVSLQNAAKEQEVIDLLTSEGLGEMKMWTSGRKFEGHFLWTGDGNLPFNYTNWYPGEPNDTDPDACVLLQANQGWFDINCDSLQPILCQPIP